MKGKGKFNISSSEMDKLNSSTNKIDLNNSVELVDVDVDVVEENLNVIDKLMDNTATATTPKSIKASAEKKEHKEQRFVFLFYRIVLIYTVCHEVNCIEDFDTIPFKI